MNVLKSMRFLVALGYAGCATPARSSSSINSKMQPSVLTARDFDAWRGHNLFEALEGLRPAFLHRNLRGESPVALVNGLLVPMEVLRLHSIAEVVEVRLVRAPDAATRYALSSGGPVIVITLR